MKAVIISALVFFALRATAYTNDIKLKTQSIAIVTMK
jgi:hypothetical protein